MTSENFLVEWDGFELRLRGSRIAELAREIVRQKNLPIRELDMRFSEGKLEIRAKATVGLTIPFSVPVRNPEVRDGAVRVTLGQPSAFGFIPVPKVLFAMVEKQLQRPGFSFSAEQMVAVILLDQFLPSFLLVEVKQIQFIDGGVAVSLGRGAADLPPQFGGSYGTVGDQP